MRQPTVLKHEFVDYIPSDLVEGTVYVSIPFATVAHKCCCGCAREVVTPLSPTDWQLIFDGRTISLYPSIGNWDYPCQSHYFITCNQVEWAPAWSQAEIIAGRAADVRAKARYYQGNNSASLPPQPLTPSLTAGSDAAESTGQSPKEDLPPPFWQKVKRWFFGSSG